MAVKGLAEPVRSWRLIGFGEAAREDRPFVGRRVELIRFKDALGSCRASGTGETMVVRGEAGIGKTRLVEEFQGLAENAGFTCHTALVLDFGAGIGQDAIRTWWHLLGLRASSDPAASRRALEQAGSDPASPTPASSPRPPRSAPATSCVRSSTPWTTRRAAAA